MTRIPMVLLLLIAACGKAPEEPQPAPQPKPAGREEKKKTPKKVVPKNNDPAARNAFGAAQAAESSDAAQAIVQYRALQARYPGSEWSKKAQARAIALEKEHSRAIEAAYANVKKMADNLATLGRYAEALEMLKRSPDTRAFADGIAIRNRARGEFNAAVRKGSIESFEGVKKRTLPDLAELCDRAIEELREMEEDKAAFEKTKVAHDEQKTLIEKARSMWPRLKKREYDAVRKELDGDREIVQAAADFWNAFLNARRSAGKMRLLDPEGKPFLARPADVDPDQLHHDCIAALAYSALPADKAETYVKSAMWHWFEGHNDIAQRDLATAKEMGDVSSYEMAFREGILRTSITKK